MSTNKEKPLLAASGSAAALLLLVLSCCLDGVLSLRRASVVKKDITDSLYRDKEVDDFLHSQPFVGGAPPPYELLPMFPYADMFTVGKRDMEEVCERETLKRTPSRKSTRRRSRSRRGSPRKSSVSRPKSPTRKSSTCFTGLDNFEGYGDGATIGVSVFNGLFSAEAAVNRNLNPSFQIEACGAICSFDKDAIHAGGGVPSIVPIVKFSYEGIYSTEDKKWIGKVVRGGLDFVIFSTEHVKVYQNGEQIKHFDKLSFFGLSYVRGKDKIGDQLVPVTRDVHFSIKLPVPVLTVRLNKKVSKLVSNVFKSFGGDWYGEYEMNGKHRDLSDIVAGLSPENRASKLKEALKNLIGNGDGPVQLRRMRKFDEDEGKFVDVYPQKMTRMGEDLVDGGLRSTTIAPPVDPFDEMDDDNLKSVANTLAEFLSN